MLPEGEGDGTGAAYSDDAPSDDTAEEVAIQEEMIDESNPFYAAKKAANQPETVAKPDYKDSSDAASDILRKMMERRRPR